MNNFPAKTLFFGCGNMGGAMLQGWLKGGVCAGSFHVISPSKRNMPKGVSVYSNVMEFNDIADMLIIAVKPQILNIVSKDIQMLIGNDTIIVSILAGIEQSDLQSIFPDNVVVRAMPNLAAALGKSPIGLFGGDISDNKKQYISNLFVLLGVPEWGKDDEFINIVTAMAGSGPAYLYRFIEALSGAAVNLGMESEQAVRLAKMLVDGGSDLSSLSPDSPRELAKKVTSEGGTTAAGLEVLDDDAALMLLVADSVKAARDRAVELAQLSKK